MCSFSKVCVFFTVLLLMFSLYTVTVIGPVTVADLGMIGFIGLSILKYKRIKVDEFNLTYLIWLVVAFLSFVNIQNPFFSTANYLSTLSRVTLSVSMLFFIPLWFSNQYFREQGMFALLNISVIHSLIQILFALLFTIGKAPFLHLVAHGNQVNRHQWLNVYDYTFYYRYAGIFEEPSWYAWFMVFSFGIVIAYELLYRKRIVKRMHLIFIVLGMLLTFSVAGIISLVLLLFWRDIRLVRGKMVFYVFAISLAGVIFFSSDNLIFMNRVYSIISGTDSSANNRLLGGAIKAWHVLSNSIFGTGIGNSDNGILYYASGKVSMASSISTQNGFLEAFVATGVVGGIIYNLPFFLLLFLRKCKIIFVIIALVFFTTNSIFVSTMWFLLGLTYYLLKEKGRNEN